MKKGIFIISLLLPLGIGMLSAALSSKGMAAYGNMNKPPFSPPAWLFPIAWTILYLMMGLASYFVLASEASHRSKTIAIVIYGIQLVMNFMWSFIFFNRHQYFPAFLWLLQIWLFVLICIFLFYRIRKIAGWLMVPYGIWLTFAAYLNLGAWILQ